MFPVLYTTNYSPGFIIQLRENIGTIYMTDTLPNNPVMSHATAHLFLGVGDGEQGIVSMMNFPLTYNTRQWYGYREALVFLWNICT